MKTWTKADNQPRRRGFTLVEVMVAGVIAAIVLGSVSLSLGQLGSAKNSSKQRFDAHMCADAALNDLKRDIATLIRADDLFFARFMLIDDSVRTPLGDLDRDEVLLFNTRLRPVRDLQNFNGEGMEYETQLRIEEDEFGPVLWRRRDAVPDEYPYGGGAATPLIEGIVGLMIEAYDGDEWYENWDSDIDGLPLAVRITVTASGHRDEEDPYEAPIAVLRTVVPIDRVAPPRDIFEADEALLDELEQQAAEEEALEEAGLGGLDAGGLDVEVDGGGVGIPNRGGPGGGGPGDRPDGGGDGGGGGGPDRSQKSPPSVGGGGGTQ